MRNRTQIIKQKGFRMEKENQPSFSPTDFSKIKVGIKSLEDAVLLLGDLKKSNPSLVDKDTVLRAIQQGDFEKMRELSNFFYKTSGIYNRLLRYMAYMYRYDWMVTPIMVDQKLYDIKNNPTSKSDKIIENFYKILNFLDNFGVKKFLGEVALKVMKNGCYYGYIITETEKVTVQELPPKYCRSRFSGNDGRPCIEFNMKFFDDYFTDVQQKERMLNLFPKEFQKGYRLYKQGKLVADFQGDSSGWYLLDKNAIKFNVNGEDFPIMISVLPAIIDLDMAQDLDRKKMQQQLLKIIIQRMPVDKNGDLVFDVEEAQQLHNNAVKMLSKAVGIDVLTTFAETDVADMSSSNSAAAADEGMDRVKEAVFDQAGVPQLIFNSDSNIALTNSILNDEAAMYNLIQQFEQFLNLLLDNFNKSPKKVVFKAQILSTTIYNYKELAKLYKEQTQLGYSKMLPQIALGQSQSSILANAYFENDYLDLVNVFIPPMSSNTMSADALVNLNGGEGESEGGGRPEKPETEKSDKTIANQESM